MSPLCLNDRSSVLSFLKTRKSASVKAMAEPGPSPAEIKEILEIAVRVPLRPGEPLEIALANWRARITTE